MVKRIKRSLAVAIAISLFLTTFMYMFAVPVHAAGKPDLKKANVSWDLKNNKTLKFKTKWYSLGVKTHTVKMTNYKVKKAKKKGYKVCSFTLTYNVKINPTSKQIYKMANYFEDHGYFGGDYYVSVLDYKTGQFLVEGNDKDVKVTFSDWKFSNYDKCVANNKYKSWIRYPKKSKINVKIVYPATYKNLVICVGGCTANSMGNLDSFWSGNGKFSKQTKLYSKKDKKFAHAMRVK